jgi:hypothetical protein
VADPKDWVYISHPDTVAIGGPVLRKSVDEPNIGWAARGWSVTEDYVLVLDEHGQSKAIPKGYELLSDEKGRQRIAKASKSTVSTAKGA